MADDAGKIFVGGLPKSCAQEALKIWAEQYGEVTNVEVKVDPMGVSRGFGFVTFADPSVAQGIVANKDNNMMDGKWIDCKMAMPPGSAPPAGKGGKGAIDPSNPKIFVGALPKSATQDSVMGYFGAFGNVTEVQVKMAEDGQCKGFAFVTFEDAASCQVCPGQLWQQHVRWKMDRLQANRGQQGQREGLRWQGLWPYERFWR